MAKLGQVTRDMTLGEALYTVASRFPVRAALVSGDERVSYAQLLERVEGLAQSLRELGIGQGDCIAALLWSEPAFVYVFFAAATLGAVIAPLPARMRRAQMEAFLRELEPALVLTSTALEVSDGLETLRALQRDLPSLRHVLVADAPSGVGPSFQSMLNAPSAGIIGAEAGSQDLLAILYTSGTTGQAKGVMHSHRSLISPVVASIKLRELWMTFLPTFRGMARWMRALFTYGLRLLKAGGRPQSMLSTMGMHTISGLEAMLQALLMGDRLVLVPRFHPVRVLETIQRERVTILIGPPIAYKAMMRVSRFNTYRLSSLLICATGSAPCPPELAREIQQKFRCAVHIGFGMTELGGGIAAASLADSPSRQAETVGQPMPGVEIKIVDDAGHTLPPGQVGELVCRSDGLMLGYFGASQRHDASADEQRWLHTGDLAIRDAEGYIQIVGRKKDVIIRGGQNIYPIRIEHHLERMPGIREAAVVGIPDALGEESVWAFVILEDGGRLTEQAIVAHCRAALEPYEIPQRVRIVDDFPRSSAGKPQKFRLREMALEELEAYETQF